MTTPNPTAERLKSWEVNSDAWDAFSGEEHLTNGIQAAYEAGLRAHGLLSEGAPSELPPLLPDGLPGHDERGSDRPEREAEEEPVQSSASLLLGEAGVDEREGEPEERGGDVVVHASTLPAGPSEEQIEAAAIVLYERGWRGTRTWDRDATEAGKIGYRNRARAVLIAADVAPQGFGESATVAASPKADKTPPIDSERLIAIRLYCENQGDKFRHHAKRIMELLDGDALNVSAPGNEKRWTLRPSRDDGYELAWFDGKRTQGWWLNAEQVAEFRAALLVQHAPSSGHEKLIAEAKAEIERAAHGTPATHAARIRSGDVEDVRLRLLVQMSQALAAPLDPKKVAEALNDHDYMYSTSACKCLWMGPGTHQAHQARALCEAYTEGKLT